MASEEQGRQTDEDSSFARPIEFQKKDHGTRRDFTIDSDLNINSVMDMMTILLVFLLINITSNPLNVRQDDFLTLARSTANYNPEDSVPITITEQHILVDRKAVVNVDCTVGGQVCQRADYKRAGNYYSVDKSYKENGSESSFLIEPLFKRLDQIVKQQQVEAKELGRKFKHVATIICDRDIPFRLIAEVVHTAGMAGLGALRFAIIKTNTR